MGFRTRAIRGSDIRRADRPHSGKPHTKTPVSTKQAALSRQVRGEIDFRGNIQNILSGLFPRHRFDDVVAKVVGSGEEKVIKLRGFASNEAVNLLKNKLHYVSGGLGHVQIHVAAYAQFPYSDAEDYLRKEFTKGDNFRLFKKVKAFYAQVAENEYVVFYRGKVNKKELGILGRRDTKQRSGVEEKLKKVIQGEINKAGDKIRRVEIHVKLDDSVPAPPEPPPPRGRRPEHYSRLHAHVGPQLLKFVG